MLNFKPLSHQIMAIWTWLQSFVSNKWVKEIAIWHVLKCRLFSFFYVFVDSEGWWILNQKSETVILESFDMFYAFEEWSIKTIIQPEWSDLSAPSSRLALNKRTFTKNGTAVLRSCYQHLILLAICLCQRLLLGQKGGLTVRNLWNSGVSQNPGGTKLPEIGSFQQ